MFLRHDAPRAVINRLTIFSKRCPDQAASFWLAAQAQAAIHLSRRFTLKHVAPSDKYHRDCYYSHSRHLSCCTLQETGMKVLVLTLHRHRHPPLAKHRWVFLSTHAIWPRDRYNRAASGALVHDSARVLARLHCHLTERTRSRGLGAGRRFHSRQKQNPAFSINSDVYLVQCENLRAVAATRRGPASKKGRCNEAAAKLGRAGG